MMDFRPGRCDEQPEGLISTVFGVGSGVAGGGKIVVLGVDSGAVFGADIKNRR